MFYINMHTIDGLFTIFFWRSNGFPDTTLTYGLVSSLFTLTFSLGNAFGPAVSGVLYEAIGFKDASLSVIGLTLLVVCIQN